MSSRGNGSRGNGKPDRRGAHTKKPGSQVVKNAKPLDPARPVWEQQQEETAKAYEAFLAYRDMDPTVRTLERVAAQLGKSVQLMNRWSAAWSWVVRAHEWDVQAERVRTDAHWEEIRRMSERQANSAVVIQRALVAPAAALVQRLTENPRLLQQLADDENLNGLVQLMGMVVTASRIYPALADMEREARGQPALMPGDQPGAAGDPRRPARRILEDEETRALAVELFERINGVG